MRSNESHSSHTQNSGLANNVNSFGIRMAYALKVITLAWIFIFHVVVLASATRNSPFIHNVDDMAIQLLADKGEGLEQLNMATQFLKLLRSLNDDFNQQQRVFGEETAVEGQCIAHLNGWAQNLTSEWSIRMIDAMSKIPEGILSGHTQSLGDFDECLATRGEIELSDPSTHGVQSQSEFKGQYCTVMLLPSAMCQAQDAEGRARMMAEATAARARAVALAAGDSIPDPRSGVIFGGAICVPSKCRKDELQAMLASYSNETGLELCIALVDCKTDDRPTLTTGDIAMIILLATLAALCVIGTGLDLWHQRTALEGSPEKSKLLQSAIAFSVYTNTKKWLNTSAGGDNLGCVHGIRFLSTAWVVLAHTLSIWRRKVWNLVTLMETYNDWTIYPILNGTIAVDTFFTLAGLLAAYNLLKALDKSRGRLNVPMLYLHRYLRLTPTYAILIGIMATLFQYMKPGPNTEYIAESAVACQNYWWHNLLYINNLVKYPQTSISTAMCHGESWYLGNDMQFFLVSPLLLWPLWKWPVIGSIVMALFTLASLVVPVVVSYVYELDATLLFITSNGNDFHGLSYNKPWMRFGPYVVGLWAGYILYLARKKKVQFKLPALAVLLGWTTSTAMALAIIFGPMKFYDPANGYDRLGSAFYGGMHRFGWGLVISWVVLACTMGYGGIINAFLSWKVFIPLGRLSFCVYMISLWLQTLYYMSARQHVSYDLYTGINLFFGHMVMSLLIGFVACMVFESPFIALEKILLPTGNAKRTPPKLQLQPEPSVEIERNNNNGESEKV